MGHQNWQTALIEGGIGWCRRTPARGTGCDRRRPSPAYRRTRASRAPRIASPTVTLPSGMASVLIWTPCQARYLARSAPGASGLSSSSTERAVTVSACCRKGSAADGAGGFRAAIPSDRNSVAEFDGGRRGRAAGGARCGRAPFPARLRLPHRSRSPRGATMTSASLPQLATVWLEAPEISRQEQLGPSSSVGRAVTKSDRRSA